MPLGNNSNSKSAGNRAERPCQERVRMPRRGGRFIHFVVALLVGVVTTVIGGGSVALALEPTTPLASFGRQGWATENGLPQNTVQALAQTQDGFLWLGTEVGLVRFDGNGFTVFDQHSKPALPGNDVQCLLAAKDGSLWVGTSDGVARLVHGALTAYNTFNGLPGNDVDQIVETSEGELWANTRDGLARF